MGSNPGEIQPDRQDQVGTFQGREVALTLGQEFQLDSDSAPGDGKRVFLPHPEIFKALDAMGYTGWIGAEYNPRGRTEDGLGWARPYGIVPRSE